MKIELKLDKHIYKPGDLVKGHLFFDKIDKSLDNDFGFFALGVERAKSTYPEIKDYSFTTGWDGKSGYVIETRGPHEVATTEWKSHTFFHKNLLTFTKGKLKKSKLPTEIPFSFKLDSSVKPSYQGNRCSILYSVLVEISRRLSRDIKNEISFEVEIPTKKTLGKPVIISYFDSKTTDRIELKLKKISFQEARPFLVL